MQSDLRTGTSGSLMFGAHWVEPPAHNNLWCEHCLSIILKDAVYLRSLSSCVQCLKVSVKVCCLVV